MLLMRYQCTHPRLQEPLQREVILENPADADRLIERWNQQETRSGFHYSIVRTEPTPGHAPGYDTGSLTRLSDSGIAYYPVKSPPAFRTIPGPGADSAEDEGMAPR